MASPSGATQARIEWRYHQNSHGNFTTGFQTLFYHARFRWAYDLVIVAYDIISGYMWLYVVIMSFFYHVRLLDGHLVGISPTKRYDLQMVFCFPTW